MFTRCGSFRLALLVLLLATSPAFAAQTVPLAAGRTAATSSDVTNLTTGTLTIFASNGYVPASVAIPVFAVANGKETQVGILSAAQPVFMMMGPSVVYREKRPDITDQTVNVGVASDLEPAASSGTLPALGQSNLAGGLPVSPASDWLLPAYAATPTFNIGTLNGAATAAGVAAVNTTLGSPFQAGGSIGNTGFNVTGTLPAFTATPTFNPGNTANTTPWLFERTAIAPSASSAAEACHVIKASAGTLYAVSGLAGQAEYFMVFNATSAPGDGAVTPVWWGQALTAGAWSVTYPNPLSMSTGITICASSTGPLTKTAISTGNVYSWEAQ
jgi:hypothetical protein